MPSAQIFDFGPDPVADNIGRFAQGFSDTYFQGLTKKKNDDLFKKIKDNYGPDVKPETIYKDVLEAEEIDEDYKTDILSKVKEYATLSSKKELTPYQSAMLDYKREDLNLKKDKATDTIEKPITAYQQKLIEQRSAQLKLQAQRINQAASDKDSKFPKLISDYSNSILKNADEQLPASDRALLNSRMRQSVQDEGLGVDEAFSEALQYVQMKNQLVDETKITEKPSSWYPPSSKREVEGAMDKAYQELEQLYEAGVESQKDLRSIARKGGWEPEEITKMLQRVFQRNGKKLKTETPKKAVEIPQEETIEDSEEEDGLDDILFGD